MEQPELTVEEMPTGDLVPYASNAKLHSKLQVEQIANSIEEFGFNDPIGVWENPQGELEIVEGHGRVLAAEKLGIETVSVIRLDHLTDEQRRAYTHVHNQTTLNSGFDLEILDAELETLDFDWESFGFGDDDAEISLGGGSEALSDAYSDNIGHVDYEPKETAHAVTDLFILDRDDLDELIAKVEDADLREMLMLRKAWFTEFKFNKIADYYAYQATPEEQRVFEAMGLVLLDRDGMIENGFADMVSGL